MITLITGGPGLGKTALVVKDILTIYSGRTIFTNIKGLVLDHSPLPHIDEWTREVFNAQGTSEFCYNFPPGSVVIIDECQQFFRPRASGSKVPPIIQAFETHRHEGVDFVLMTQGTNLIDFNLKPLIKGGKHIHLRTTWLGRYKHESSEIIDYDNKSALGLTAKRKYKLPKEVFGLYKSAELHTVPPKVKLPIQVYIIIGLLILGGLLTWRFGSKIESTVNPVKESEASQRWAAQPTGAGALSVPVPAKLVEALTPTDPHNPRSAPIYASVQSAVYPPEIVACIASRSKCVCYTQQNTRIYVPEDQCRQRVSAEFYDPYQAPRPMVADTKKTDDGKPQPEEEKTASDAPAGEVIEMHV